MQYVVNPMTMNDLPRVLEIEDLAYPTSQWPSSAYRRELQDNKWAHYIVARDMFLANELKHRQPEHSLSRRSLFPFLSPSKPAANDADLKSIVGYAGVWLMIDEAHVTTIATHTEVRGHGVGELLLVNLLDIAMMIGARWSTLEVRVSNITAQRLYEKYGFTIVSTRPRYYSDNNEDAYIMWTEEIMSTHYQQLFTARKTALFERLQRDEEKRAHS